MDFGNLLNLVNQNLRSLIRRIEETSYKLNNAVTAVDFNKTCIQNGLKDPLYPPKKNGNGIGALARGGVGRE